LKSEFSNEIRINFIKIKNLFQVKLNNLEYVGSSLKGRIAEFVCFGNTIFEALNAWFTFILNACFKVLKLALISTVVHQVEYSFSLKSFLHHLGARILVSTELGNKQGVLDVVVVSFHY